MMAENANTFRSEFAAKLMEIIPTDQLQAVMRVFDITSCDYDITRKTMEIITTDGIPDLVRWYLADKAVQSLSATTLKQYYYKLRNFFKTIQKPVNQIESTDIIRYLFVYKQDKCAGDYYRDNIRLVLSGFFHWCYSHKHIDINPCDNVDKIRFQVTPRETFSEIELEEMRWHCSDLREKALLDFLVSTGVRATECSCVKLSDIDWSERMVKIPHGKGNKFRVVYFNAEAEVSMKKYIESRSDDTNSLFVSKKRPHNPIGKECIEDIIARIGARVGIHAYPHRCRHRFGTYGIQSGMPLEMLQVLMGHAKPETTLIYAKMDQTDIQREHRRRYA